MQDEAKEKNMTSEGLLSRAANKLATQMAEEKIEQGMEYPIVTYGSSYAYTVLCIPSVVFTISLCMA